MTTIIIIFTVMTTLAIDNAEFFGKVEELKARGYEWQYTGKQEWIDKGDNPAIVIESYKGTKPYTLWSLQDAN